MKCPRDSGDMKEIEKDGVVDAVLARNFASPLRKIAIDKCPACNGIWLDAGELKHYRTLFPTRADWEKVSDEFIAKNILPMLQTERQKSQESLRQAQRFANMFRFICPSYHITLNEPGAD